MKLVHIAPISEQDLKFRAKQFLREGSLDVGTNKKFADGFETYLKKNKIKYKRNNNTFEFDDETAAKVNETVVKEDKFNAANQDIDVASIKPDAKDAERAEGLEWKGSTFHGNRDPFGSEAAKMAKLIKDPVKLVRRAKAVIQRFGDGKGKSVDRNAWAPFESALQDMGFTPNQIAVIKKEKRHDWSESIEKGIN